MSRYRARWTTAEDQRRYQTSANGVVEDTLAIPSEVVCFASPFSRAERIACALNLTNRFNLEELKGMNDALMATATFG